MPQLSALARSGRFFPNCYANATHSDYSDPCILSSLYPARSERPHYYRRDDPWPKVLLPDPFKRAGYGTAMFSSQNEAWSNMHLFYESGDFDVFFDSRTYKGSSLPEKGYFTRWMNETGQIAGKLDDAVTMEHAINWIQGREKRPFCMAMNLQASHFPYERPDGVKGPFEPGVINFSAGFTNYPSDKAHIVQNAYFNSLQYVDMQIGRLVEFLDSSRLRADTILVITGDHGESFHEDGICGHGRFPVEAVLKVGLIVNYPKAVSASIDAHLSQAIDILPTISQLAGLPPEPAFQGIDILASDRPPAQARLVFVHCWNPAVKIDAVIAGTGWKYINDVKRMQRQLQLNPSVSGPNPNLRTVHPEVAEILHEIIETWHARQIAYYQRPRYYNLFHPPRDPQLSEAQRTTLLRAARTPADGSFK